MNGDSLTHLEEVLPRPEHVGGFNRPVEQVLHSPQRAEHLCGVAGFVDRVDVAQRVQDPRRLGGQPLQAV